MKEILNRLLHRKVVREQTFIHNTEWKMRPINPVNEPDLARLQAIWTTPGVLNGTFEVGLTDGSGTLITDFDRRNESGYPTKTFVPSTSKEGQK